ncbi:hypothetical protein K1T71_010743 [Dendrolimus kikuchii]|uniref:Uncharacterized protein n=1 Tax=Dendrolimus kikuchii TaxID=765133 RepID=A0ACC1CPP5_9NEOP|nr:hypothetical protein K1T71_010743 [Dendrolimus kikuchii]
MIINNVVHSGPALSIPAHLSYGEFILDKLKEHYFKDDTVAMINGETGHKTTYKYILQETVNFAVGLQKLGVKRGDVVALFSENRDEFIIAAMAGSICGATVTTYNVMYTKDEIIHVSKISQPTVIVCSEIAIQRSLDTLKSIRCIKKIIQMNGKPLDPTVLPYSSILIETNVLEYEAAEVQGWTDVAYILYSSGTTGLPKGVMLTHVNALYSASNLHNGKDNKNSARLLTIVPWYHAYGLMSTINYLLLDRFMVYFSGFTPDKYLNAIQEFKLTMLLAVPPIVVFLAKHPLVVKYDLSSVQVVWCGAAPLSAETIALALKRMPNCIGIFQAYGMTETSLAATKDSEEENVPRRPGAGGYPISGVKIKVVDIETRKKLGPNEQGEICIKGPILMKGYAGNDKESREIIDVEGYLKTGDIGYYNEDGCFFIVDRLKELIKYKGSQVAPATVENVLLQHNGVAECGVVGAPDEVAGELPTAFVVPKPGANVTEQELIAFSNTLLSPSSRLHGGVFFVKEIPKNPSVHGPPALSIPAHLSYGQFILDKLKEHYFKDDTVAMVNGDTGHETRYKYIVQETVNFAAGLQKIGVKKGDVVALSSENRDEFIVAAMAGSICGATITTFNVEYTKEEIIHASKISQPTVIICSESSLLRILDILKSIRCIKKIIQMNGEPLNQTILPYSSLLVETNVLEYEAAEVQGWTDVAYILYSSGTTGLPKGVMLTHTNILYFAARMLPGLDRENSTRFLTLVPWYHAYGLISTINYFLLNTFFVYLSGFNPDKYLNAIQEYKLTMLLVVPPIVVFLAKHPNVLKYDLSSVAIIWSGAAPLSAETISLALKRMPNCKGIFQGYGMTETTLGAIQDSDDENVPRKPGACGYPIYGVKVKVVDIETRRKLGPNEHGEICIKGPILMKGYAGNEKESRQIIDVEGYLKTGDVGYYDEDGCFFIVDRLKELIKYKGNQVAPATVETVLLQHNGVAECGVVGAPDEVAGELPTAFVVLKPGANVTEQELIEFSRKPMEMKRQ